MKSILFLVTFLFAFASAADISLFVGPQAKTFKVKKTAGIFATVDANTSEVGAQVAVGQAGESLEVVGVYSPYFKSVEKGGWHWTELFKFSTPSNATVDPSGKGYQGVATLAEPNQNDKLMPNPIFPHEKITVAATWPQWVVVKKNGVTGKIYIEAGELIY